MAARVPTVPQRVLAAALERHRDIAGLTRGDVARELEWSAMKPYRIETARVAVAPGDIRELARLYNLDDAATEQLVTLARQAKRPGWWKGMAEALPSGFAVHLELESTALGIRTFAEQFVPGLWQTEGYARAVLGARSLTSTPEQIERQVTVRMRRKQVLDRDAPPPPQMWVILDEAVIRRAVGGRDVMRAQLERLSEVSSQPWVTLQVLPFSAGAHMAAYGAFSLFDPSDPAFPVTASTDRPAGTLIEDDPSSIAQYTRIFDHLRATALNPAESRALISEAISLL
ncbi:MAG: helix-turn-helix domain-containing protein [Trebonia sp.]